MQTQTFVQHIGLYWNIHIKTENDTDTSVADFSNLGCAELLSVSVTDKSVRDKLVSVSVSSLNVCPLSHPTSPIINLQ